MNNEQLIAAIRDGVPLEEPVSVAKAMMAHSLARAVLDKGTGPLACVCLVNIQAAAWVHNPETANAYAEGFNRGADWTRSAIIHYAESAAPTAAVAAGTIDTPDFRELLGDFGLSCMVAERAISAGRLVAHIDAAITAASQKAREEAGKALTLMRVSRDEAREELAREKARRIIAQRTAGGDAVAWRAWPDRQQGDITTREATTEVWRQNGVPFRALGYLAAQPVPEAAAQADSVGFDECCATGQSCQYGAHGREGEMQCKYCGKEQPTTETAATPAPVSAEPMPSYEFEEQLDRLVTYVSNAAHECGDHRGDEASYDVLLKAANKEEDNLKTFVRGIRRASLPSAGAPVSGAEQALLPALKKAAKLLRAAGFTMTGTATSEIVAAITTAESCTVPPAGWQCTRVAGHDGPCAAVPVADVQELPATVKREGGYAYLLIFGQEVNNWDRDTTYAEVYAKRVNEAALAKASAGAPVSGAGQTSIVVSSPGELRAAFAALSNSPPAISPEVLHLKAGRFYEGESEPADVQELPVLPIKTWQERYEPVRVYYGHHDERPYMKAEITELRGFLEKKGFS